MSEKQPFLKRIIMSAVQGLLTIVPLVVTLYLIYWIASSLEKMVRKSLILFMPESLYFPGLGIAVGIVILLVIGWTVNMFFMKQLIAFGANTIEKIPLVKTIYTGIRDLVGFMNMSKKHGDGSVVLVEVGDKKIIGFVTDMYAGKTLGIDDPNLVGVYMPLGYMIGGYTVYLDKSKLTRLSMSAEDAMRIALTGGMATGNKEEI